MQRLVKFIMVALKRKLVSNYICKYYGAYIIIIHCFTICYTVIIKGMLGGHPLKPHWADGKGIITNIITMLLS